MRITIESGSGKSAQARVHMSIRDLCALLNADESAVRAAHGTELRIHTERETLGEFIIKPMLGPSSEGSKFSWHKNGPLGSFRIAGSKLGFSLDDLEKRFDVSYSVKQRTGALICRFDKAKGYRLRPRYKPASKRSSVSLVLSDAITIINQAASRGDVMLAIANNQLSINLVEIETVNSKEPV